MEGFIFLFVIGVGLAVTGVWLFALIEVIQSEFKGENDKLIWLLLVILLPFLGTILYFTVGRNQKLDPPHSDLV